MSSLGSGGENQISLPTYKVTKYLLRYFSGGRVHEHNNASLARSDQDDEVVRLRNEASRYHTELRPFQVHGNPRHDPKDTVAGGRDYN